MTFLAKENRGETAARLAGLLISKESPWVLQQPSKGPEYFSRA